MTKQLIIGTIASGKDQLLNTFNAVPDDKLNWKPLDNGRSALDLAGDAAQTPLLAVQLLQLAPGASMPPMRQAFAEMSAQRANWTKADVIQHLEANHQTLAAAIEALSDEDLARPLSIPMGPEFTMTLPLAGWAMMAYRSYISRFAQINYIQTLYGDFDGH
jgi:hypothetical protein